MWEGLAPLVALAQVVAVDVPAPVAARVVASALLVAEEALLNPGMAGICFHTAVSSLPVVLLPNKKPPASDTLCPHIITYLQDKF